MKVPKLEVSVMVSSELGSAASVIVRGIAEAGEDAVGQRGDGGIGGRAGVAEDQRDGDDADDRGDDGQRPDGAARG